MSQGTCSVMGCERPRRCRQLCQLHYGRLHRTGRVGPADRLVKGPEAKILGPCSVNGCEQATWLRGLCRMHYDRRRFTGTVGTTDRLRGARGVGRRPVPCAVEGCDRLAMGRGLCNLHHLRWRRKGDPGPAGPQPRPRGNRGPCMVEGCVRTARIVATQMCDRHHARWKATGDPGPGIIRPVGSTAGTCSVIGCAGSIEARGLCTLHYFADQRLLSDPNLRRTQARINSQRRRARKLALPVEKYTIVDILMRDGDDCVLCGEPLDLDTAFPDPRSLTVEHLECISWPRSAGDVLANVAAAHYLCNVRRCNRPHPAAARKRVELISLAKP